MSAPTSLRHAQDRYERSQESDDSFHARTYELMQRSIRDYDGAFRDWLLLTARHEPLRIADAVAAACQARIGGDQEARNAGEILGDIIARFADDKWTVFAERADAQMEDER